MVDHSGGVDEETKEMLVEELEIEDEQEIIEPMDRALKHAEDEEAKYWVRTAFQHLLNEARQTS